jgi:hypothetical protein
MHRTIPLLFFLAALAVPGTSQAAIRTVDYRVVIDGTADYNRADADAEASAQHDEAIVFRTTIPKLTFHGRVAEDSTGALGTANVTHGSYVITGPSGQVRCSSHEASDVTAGGLDATYAEDRTVFAARVIDSVTVAVGGCDLAGMGTWPLQLGSGGDEVGIGVFDGSFSVPHDRIGEAAMSFPLHGEVTGASCPMHHAMTVLCSLSWDATVTFTRTGEGEEDDDVPVLPLGPGPLPAPPPDPDDDLLLPLVAKAKLAGNLSRASLPLACAADCRGTLTAKAGARTLATRRFALKAGRRGRAGVRFDRADRRAIRRAGKIRLTVKLTGGSVTVRRTITLRARKA